MSGSGEHDSVRLHVALACLNADGCPADGVYACYFAVFDDIDTVRCRGSRISPRYGVMPCRAPATLYEATHDGKPPRCVHPHLGTKAIQGRQVQQLSIDPRKAHGITPSRQSTHVIIRQRDIDDPTRAV